MCVVAIESKDKSTTPAVDVRKPRAITKADAPGVFRLTMRRNRDASNQLLIFADQRINAHHCTSVVAPIRRSGVTSSDSSTLAPAAAITVSPPSTPLTPTADEDDELALFATSPPRLAPTPERYRRIVAFPESILIPDF
jgi:hypothetical protein